MGKVARIVARQALSLEARPPLLGVFEASWEQVGLGLTLLVRGDVGARMHGRLLIPLASAGVQVTTLATGPLPSWSEHGPSMIAAAGVASGAPVSFSGRGRPELRGHRAAARPGKRAGARPLGAAIEEVETDPSVLLMRLIDRIGDAAAGLAHAGYTAGDVASREATAGGPRVPRTCGPGFIGRDVIEDTRHRQPEFSAMHEDWAATVILRNLPCPFLREDLIRVMGGTPILHLHRPWPGQSWAQDRCMCIPG